MRKIYQIKEDDDRKPPEIDKSSKDASIDFQRYSSQKETFHQIDKHLLIPEEEVVFSIFIHKGLDFQPLIEATEDSPIKITSEILNSEADFLIKHSELDLYNEYLVSLNNKILFDKQEEKTKAILIKESTKLAIRKTLSDPRSGENIKKAEPLVQEMSSAIISNRDIIFSLISIKTHDYYTYTHSTNVEIFSIAMGATLGLSESEIFNIGLGALLHDVGKCNIPIEILNKEGKLTQVELNIMQNHVIETEKILKLHNKIPKDSFDTALQHHEKLPGNGYPYKLSDAEIGLFGRISAITDCYDALTTERPYKKALTPFKALDIMLQERGSYDLRLLEIFIKMLGKRI